jgi:hypothetical protein
MKIASGIGVLLVLISMVVMGADAAGRTTIPGYGPYAFGMSQAAATKGDPAWHARPLAQVKGVVLVGIEKRTTIEVEPAGQPVAANIILGFLQGRLCLIVITVSDPARATDPVDATSLWQTVHSAITEVYAPSIITSDERPDGVVGRQLGPSLLLADSTGNTVYAFQRKGRTSVEVVYRSAALVHAMSGF